MEDVLHILLGWLLGMLSPAIVNKISQGHLKKDLQKSIRAELNDIKIRLAMMSFLLYQNLGKIDMEFMKWLKPIFDEYDGPELSLETKALFKKIDLKNQEIASAVISLVNRNEPTGQSLKTINVGLIKASESHLHLFNNQIQTYLLEFKYAIEVLNQEVLDARDYLKMTFESSLSDVNHAAITKDLLAKYGHIAATCVRAGKKVQTLQVLLS